MKIAILGECMIEFSKGLEEEYHKSFAGDTFNTAYYLKQINKKVNIEYITGIGNDSISNDFLNYLKYHEINANYIERIKNKTLGLYLINTDNGERSFSYWRDTSAAKKLFDTKNLFKFKRDFLTFDMIYFSAITLAILSKKGRKNLFKILKEAQNNGVKIAYDSNYREKLYKNKKESIKQHNKALKYCSIFLPSLEDEQKREKNINYKDIILRCLKHGEKEIIIKNGSKSIIYYHNKKVKKFSIKKVKNVVDTTAAGDSFNGAYLANRLAKRSVIDSIKIASRVAKKVILSRGAIINI